MELDALAECVTVEQCTRESLVHHRDGRGTGAIADVEETPPHEADRLDGEVVGRDGMREPWRDAVANV